MQATCGRQEHINTILNIEYYISGVLTLFTFIVGAIGNSLSIVILVQRSAYSLFII